MKRKSPISLPPPDEGNEPEHSQCEKQRRRSWCRGRKNQGIARGARRFFRAPQSERILRSKRRRERLCECFFAIWSGLPRKLRIATTSEQGSATAFPPAGKTCMLRCSSFSPKSVAFRGPRFILPARNDRNGVGLFVVPLCS